MGAQHKMGPKRIGAPKETTKKKIDFDDVDAGKKACKGYKVDLGAANFGQCMCGRPKKDHF